MPYRQEPMPESKYPRLAGRMVVLLVLMLGVFVMFAGMQRKLIYFPSLAQEQQQLLEAAASGLQPWRGEDGSLLGWRQARKSSKRRLLVFHGNAGYALHRAYFVEGLREADSGWDVILFEYPGYGARSGSPSEKTIKAAAAAALQRLLQEDPQPIYLAGESLGSSVASYLAGVLPQQVAGLLLVTPFTSLVDIAAHHYPWPLVRYLLQERYDSVAALSRYHGPVAFLLAGRDEVVPIDLGRALHASYGGPKLLRVEAGAGHNSLPYHPGAPWWAEISEFLTTTPATGG
jgi:hypothetical protein